MKKKLADKDREIVERREQELKEAKRQLEELKK